MKRTMIKFSGNWVPIALCSIADDGLANDCKCCKDYCDTDNQECNVCGIQHSFDRLAAYEKTGLEPEEIKCLKIDLEKNICTGCWLKDNIKIAKKIAALESLLELAGDEIERLCGHSTEISEKIRDII